MAPLRSYNPGDSDATGRFQEPSQGPGMTTTSFQTRQGCYPHAFAHPEAVLDDAGASLDLPPGASANAYAAQALRMKAFAAQRQFQAPVADDFARGMLAPGQGSDTATSPLKHIRSALAVLIAGLGQHKPG